MEIRSMRPYLVVSAPSTGVLEFCKVKNVTTRGSKEEIV